MQEAIFNSNMGGCRALFILSTYTNCNSFSWSFLLDLSTLCVFKNYLGTCLETGVEDFLLAELVEALYSSSAWRLDHFLEIQCLGIISAL